MEPVNPISLENLCEACKLLCPEKTGYYATHFEELNKSVNWYGFAAIMKKEAEMKARLAATRNKMAAGLGKNNPQN